MLLFTWTRAKLKPLSGGWPYNVTKLREQLFSYHSCILLHSKANISQPQVEYSRKKKLGTSAKGCIFTSSKRLVLLPFCPLSVQMNRSLSHLMSGQVRCKLSSFSNTRKGVLCMHKECLQPKEANIFKLKIYIYMCIYICFAVIWECECCQNIAEGLSVSWPRTTVPIFFFKEIKFLSPAISQDPSDNIFFYNMPSPW